MGTKTTEGPTVEVIKKLQAVEAVGSPRGVIRLQAIEDSTVDVTFQAKFRKIQEEMEQEQRRRRKISLMMLAGASIGATLGYCWPMIKELLF